MGSGYQFRWRANCASHASSATADLFPNMARVQGLARMEQEDCVPEVACFNCQKLVEDSKECKLPQHSGRQMIIPISQQLKVEASLLTFQSKRKSQHLVTILSCLIDFNY